MTTTPAKIVCVDDDPDILTSITRTLSVDRHELLATSEPHRALAWVAEGDVAVLLSDYEMPGMNGVELAIAARRLRPATVRMLLTGVRTVDAAMAGINRGEVFRYITKPFEAPMLRRSIAEAIARHRELMSISDEYDVTVRRTKMLAELEAEYPGIASVVRDDDHTYVVPVMGTTAGAWLELVGRLAR